MKPTIQPITISSSDVFCRALNPADLVQIFAIEQRAHSFPWRKTQLLDSLNQPRTRAFGIILTHKIVGFVFAQVVIENADILNFCIDPRHQNQGLGAQLLTHLLKELAQSAVTSVFLEVRAGNTNALALYKRHNFAEVGRRKQYYSNGENAKILCFSMSG